MGKGQRSQAASSHRASEMLAGGHAGFVGFQTLGPAGLAAAGAVDETEGMSGEMRMIVGRLRKKDATTKLKSLQELLALLPTCDEADLRALLIHWPRIFARMGLDVDRRVRESVHAAMAALAGRAGRLLGTALKELIGTWLCGQYDSSRDVAQQCRQALSVTFPGEKRNKALAVCRAELLAFAKNNILQATPQTFCENPSVVEDPHDLNDKYERAVAATLLVYGELVSGLAADDATLVEESAELLAPTGIWRLLKNDSGAIRAAVYSLCAVLAGHPLLLAAIPIKTIAAALITTGLAEKDPLALRTAAQAITAATTAAPQLWTTLNTRKAVLPALVAVLRDGGRMTGDTLFGQLLLWLAAMPAEMFGDGIGFFESLFGALRQGLTAIRADRAALVACHTCYAALVMLVRDRKDGGSLAGAALGQLVASLMPQQLHRQYPLAALQDTVAAAVGSSAALAVSCLATLTTVVISAGGSGGGGGSLGGVVAASKQPKEGVASDVAAVAVVPDSAAVASSFTSAAASVDAALSSIAAAAISATIASASAPLHVLGDVNASTVFANVLATVTATLAPSVGDAVLLHAWAAALQAALSNALLSTSVTQSAPQCADAASTDAVSDTVTVVNTSSMTSLSMSTVLGFLKAACALLVGNSVHLVPVATASAVVLSLGGASAVWTCLVSPVLVVLVPLLRAGGRKKSGQSDSETLQLCITALASVAARIVAVETDAARPRLAATVFAAVPSQPWQAALLTQFASEPALLAALESKRDDVASCFLTTISSKAVDSDASLLLALPSYQGFLSTQQSTAVADALAASLEPYGRAMAVDEFARAAFRAAVALVAARGLGAAEQSKLVTAVFAAAHPLSGSRDLAGEPCWPGLAQAASSDGSIAPIVTSTLRTWVGALTLQNACRAGRGLAWLANLGGPSAVDAVVNWREPTFWKFDSAPDTLRCVQGLLPASLLSGIPIEGLFTVPTVNASQQINMAMLTYFMDACVTAGHSLTALAVTLARGLDVLTQDAIERDLAISTLTRLSVHEAEIVLQSLVEQTTASCAASLFSGIRAIAASLSTRCDLAPLLAVVTRVMQSPDGSGVAGAMAVLEASALASADLEPVFASYFARLAAPSTLFAGHVALAGAMLSRLDPSRAQAVVSDLIAAISRHRDADGDLLAAEAEMRVPLCVETAKLFLAWVRRSPTAADPLWEFVLCNALAWLTIPLAGLAAATLVAHTCSLVAAIERCAHKSADWTDFFRPATSAALLPHFLTIPALLAYTPFSSSSRSHPAAAAAHAAASPASNVTVTPAASVLWASMAEATRLLCVEKLSSDVVDTIFGAMAAPLLSVHGAVTALLTRALADNIVPKGLVAATKAAFPSLRPGAHVSVSSRALCLWLLQLHAAKIADPSLQEAIASAQSAQFAQFVELVFSAIPQNTSQEALTSGLGVSFFTSPFSFVSAEDQGEVRILANIAVHCYWSTLAQLSSLARTWWEESCPPKLAHRITALHVKTISPLLIARECASIEASCSRPGGFVVQTRPATREIAATLQVDEISMDVVITLSEIYPFGNISVSGTTDVMATRQRNWNLQMQAFLMCQNGSIMSALETWTKNVTKHFEGADQCVVCYSVMHATSRQLPDKRCRTCRNPFHATCLFKWFSTSGQSSCPMCRNLF